MNDEPTYDYVKGVGWVPTIERTPQPNKWVKYKINWGEDTWTTIDTNVTWTGTTWIID